MVKRKLLSEYRDKPTFLFLLITYAVVSICPLIILGSTSFAATKNIIARQTIAANIERIKQIQSSVDMVLGTIEEKTYVLLMDDNISRLRNTSREDLTDVKSVLDILDLKSKMQSMQLSSEYIESIYFYNKDRDFIITSNGNCSKLEDFTDTEWYTDLERVGGKGSWGGTRKNIDRGNASLYTTTAKDVVSFIKPASPYFQSFNGFLIVNLYERKLNELLAEVSGQSKDDIFIANREGMVLTGCNPNRTGTGITLPIINKIGKSRSGYFTYTDDSHRQFVYYYAVASDNWIYLLRNPSHQLLNIPKNIGMLTLLLCLFLITANIIVSFLLSKKVYIPINNLLVTVRKVGNYKYQESTNEFDFIDKAIKVLYEEKNRLNDFVDHNKQIIKTNILWRLLTGDMENPEEFQAQLRQDYPDLNKKYFSSFLLMFRGIGSVPDSKENIGIHHAIIIDICENLQNDNLACIGMSIDIDKIAFVVNTNDIELMKRFSNHLLHRINEEFEINANIIHGNYYTSVFSISKSYQEALTVLKNKILLEENSVIFFDPDLMEANEYPGYPVEIEEKIIRSLQHVDVEEAMKHFREFVKCICFGGTNSKTYFENCCIRLISGIIRMIELAGHNADEIIGSNIYHEFLMNNYYMSDIESWFYRLFEDITVKVYKEEEKYLSFKEAIRSYLYENYEKDISLETIADHIGISYSYVRKIFAKIFGCSFTYFLNMIRIDNATEMLEKTEKTAYDIAVAVGYKNEQSFYRNFKKYTGYTPIEYRRDRTG